jgi:hypothetical protein
MEQKSIVQQALKAPLQWPLFNLASIRLLPDKTNIS